MDTNRPDVSAVGVCKRVALVSFHPIECWGQTFILTFERRNMPMHRSLSMICFHILFR
jgi:hypothetical protein